MCSFLIYRFIREDADNAPGGWEVDVARKYYSKLFREYCIADLSRYKVWGGCTASRTHSARGPTCCHRPHNAQHAQVSCASYPHPSAQGGKVGLRWRTEKEVVAGKGQFVCGARGCDVRQGLASFEVCNNISTTITAVHHLLHSAVTSTTASAGN